MKIMKESSKYTYLICYTRKQYYTDLTKLNQICHIGYEIHGPIWVRPHIVGFYFYISPQIDAGWNKAANWTTSRHGDPEAVLWSRYLPIDHERKHRAKISCPRLHVDERSAIYLNVFCVLMIDSVLCNSDRISVVSK